MVLIVVLGKVLANILLADFRGKWLVRFLVLLPWTTPVALSAISWLWLLDSIYSPIDWLLRQVGLLGPGENMYWLGEPGLAMASVIAVHVWRLTPLAAVIMMAGLVAIPRDMDDAARLDGAGFWRRMFEVTIPLTLPVIAVAAVFAAIFTFTDMAVVDVLTGGGPTTPPRCSPAGPTSAASTAATSARARRSRCSCSRCCWPRRSRCCARCAGWRCVTGERRRRTRRRGSGPARRLRAVRGRHVLARVRRLPRRGRWRRWSARRRSCGAWSRRSSRTGDLYNPANNPFLFNRPPTSDHVRYLFTDTAFPTFVGNTLFVGVLVVADHAGARRCPRRTRWPG